MNIRESLHTPNTGVVITSFNNDNVTSLSNEYLNSLLKKYGYILMRGFNHSIEQFSQLVRQNSGRISLDPARSFDGNTAQKVDAGYDKVGLHCENGNSPFWPDLCWFYSQKAADRGSETTVCDGKQVREHLSQTAREAFLKKNIMYSRRVDEKKWKTYVFHALAGQPEAPQHIEDASFQQLLSLTSDAEGAHITLNEDGSIYYQFETPAIRASTINVEEKYNFANSIFGPSNHYEKPLITFADGCEIPPELLSEAEEVCDRFTHNVLWQTGDIVMIDNTRVMHGRRRIEDRSRTIFNALSYID